ncbi:MAG: GTP-binding protein [Deltaproteobacteria bacterium]|nr:GTP-binding protein [Deltaproteobacteria bacterium]
MDADGAEVRRQKTPFVVLTGFLGAGKTSAINRVLQSGPTKRVAFIVNELGRIDIDARLLRERSGDVVEIAGGCVCHEVRTQEELWEGLGEITRRSNPDIVVLETTGIAEPGAILEGLALLPDERRHVRSAGVITVVDAEMGVQQLERFAEARHQVQEADRILLSKLDRTSAAGLAEVHDRLQSMNPAAERVAFPAGPEGDAELAAWMLDVRNARVRVHRNHAHEHGQLVAVSVADDVPLVETPLRAFLARFGPELVRMKGFVRLAGEERPWFLERAGAQTLLSPFHGATPVFRTEIVFIGEGLDAAAIRRQLWACRAEQEARPWTT